MNRKVQREIVRRLLSASHTKEYAYEMGKDCVLHGANTTNCHFSLFASEELMKEWERGKREAPLAAKGGK